MAHVPTVLLSRISVSGEGEFYLYVRFAQCVHRDLYIVESLGNVDVMLGHLTHCEISAPPHLHHVFPSIIFQFLVFVGSRL